MLAYTTLGVEFDRDTILIIFIVGCMLYALSMTLLGTNSTIITTMFALDMMYICYKGPLNKHYADRDTVDKRVYIVDDGLEEVTKNGCQ